MMTDAQLSAFRTRMTTAAARGYGVAKADLYLADLVEEAGGGEPPAGAAMGSAAHLLSLANDALAVRAGTKKKGKKAKKAAPKPAPAPKPAADDGDGNGEPGWPDDWSKEDMYALAQKYDIDGRSKMDRDDLIIAIEDYEKANPE